MKHTIPRLNTPDIVLSVWGVDLSVRQFLLIILAALLAVNIFVVSAWAGGILRWGLTLSPFLLAFAFGWARIDGLPLELVLFAWLRYRLRPTRYVWRSLPVPTLTEKKEAQHE